MKSLVMTEVIERVDVGRELHGRHVRLGAIAKLVAVVLDGVDVVAHVCLVHASPPSSSLDFLLPALLLEGGELPSPARRRLPR